MIKVVGVKFKEAGKLYYFSPGSLKVSKGDNVIVETARGLEFGTVTMEETEIKESEIVAPLKNIIRTAERPQEAQTEPGKESRGAETVSGKNRCP